MVSGENSRIEYIDIARAIGIFLVVLGHIFTEGTWKEIIYSFHIPLFFIISGMLLKDNRRGFKELKVRLNKKFICYFIPYLLWAAIYAPLSLTNLMKIFYGTKATLLDSGSCPSLWFLPVLFLGSCLSEIIIFICSKINEIKYRLISESVIVIVLFVVGVHITDIEPFGWPLSLNCSMVASGFMLVGFMLKDKVNDLLCDKMVSLISAIFSSILVWGNGFIRAISISGINMSSSMWGESRLVYIVAAFLGSWSILSMSSTLTLFFKDRRLLNYIGKNTLGIMAIQLPLVHFFRGNVGVIGLSNNSPCVAIILSMLVILICIPIIIVLNRILPISLGRLATGNMSYKYGTGHNI